MNFTPVDKSNTAEAIEILAEAFSDDPVINWCCNHPASLAPFFAFTLPMFIEQHLTYLDPLGRGAASWLGPEQRLHWPVTFATAATVFSFGGSTGMYRLVRSGMQTERYHPKRPHYYLFAIGVKSGHKGQGIGTRLIAEMLRHCDNSNMPAYLENSKPENLPFYEGHGFEIQREIRFTRSAPPLWLMWREPKVSSPGATQS
ncbi:GNAT family N-acetyltransferase [bacterium]|nr:GNAT family N-acetyltransferase [bacterium]